MKIVRQLGNLKVALKSGAGQVRSGTDVNEVCIMQAAWLISHHAKDLDQQAALDPKFRAEPSDQPDCVHEVLRSFCIKINDTLDDAARDRLWGFLPRLMGTDCVSADVAEEWRRRIQAWQNLSHEKVGGPKAEYESNSEWYSAEALNLLHELLRLGETQIGEVRPEVAEREVRIARRVAETFVPVAKA